jgi:Protein of unknown function (DUF2690)
VNPSSIIAPSSPIRARLRRRVSVLGVVLGVLGGGIAVTAAGDPAGAAGSCVGAVCNGKSPVAMGCTTDAITVNSITLEDHASGGTFGKTIVDLRYSKKCRASWARVRSSAGGTAHVTRSSAWIMGYSTTTARVRLSAGTVFSNMRAGHVAACGRTSYNGGAVIDRTCVSEPG